MVSRFGKAGGYADETPLQTAEPTLFKNDDSGPASAGRYSDPVSDIGRTVDPMAVAGIQSILSVESQPGSGSC